MTNRNEFAPLAPERSLPGAVAKGEKNARKIPRPGLKTTQPWRDDPTKRLLPLVSTKGNRRLNQDAFNNASISFTLASTKCGSRRLSTFRRNSGSVFEPRRLKRHSANSRLMPSVLSMFEHNGE